MCESQREGNVFIYGMFLPSFLWSVTLGHRCVLSTLFPLAYHNRIECSTGCSLSVHPKILTVPQLPQIFQQLAFFCTHLAPCASLHTSCIFNVLHNWNHWFWNTGLFSCHAHKFVCFKHCVSIFFKQFFPNTGCIKNKNGKVFTAFRAVKYAVFIQAFAIID